MTDDKTMQTHYTNDSSYMQEVFCYSIPENMEEYEHRDLEERLMEVAPEFVFRFDRVPFFDNQPDVDAVLIFAHSGDEYTELPEVDRELKAAKIASFLQGIIGDRKMYAWKTHIPIAMMIPLDDYDNVPPPNGCNP